MNAKLLSVVRQVLIAFGAIQAPRLQPIPLRSEQPRAPGKRARSG